MNIKKTASSLAQPNALVNVAANPAETIVAESQLTVGNVGLTQIENAPITYSYILINRSVGGQVLRIGSNPGFAPAAGLSLNVGESVTLNNIAGQLNAIASAAGALLDRLVVNP
jgi:hypothetical protein